MECQNSETLTSNEETSSFSNRGSTVYEDIDDENHPTAILLSTDDYPGCLNLQLILTHPYRKRKWWCYSSVLKKLYININKELYVQFRLKRPESGDIDSMKESLFVRALPVYAAPEFLHEAIVRCPVHVMADVTNGQFSDPWLYHILKAEHLEAVYHVNRKSNRHSVVVPVHTPALSSEFITIIYKFTCNTSCPLGLNRRLVHLVFTLENAQGQIFARKKLLVKICSSPRRDLRREEILSEIKIHGNSRKRNFKEVDNSMAYTSTGIHSPAMRAEMEHVDEEENVEDNNIYTIPSFIIKGKQRYISILELLHGYFLGLLVRNNASIDLQYNTNRVIELLHKIEHEDERLVLL